MRYLREWVRERILPDMGGQVCEIISNPLLALA